MVARLVERMEGGQESRIVSRSAKEDMHSLGVIIDRVLRLAEHEEANEIEQEECLGAFAAYASVYIVKTTIDVVEHASSDEAFSIYGTCSVASQLAEIEVTTGMSIMSAVELDIKTLTARTADVSLGALWPEGVPGGWPRD